MHSVVAHSRPSAAREREALRLPERYRQRPVALARKVEDVSPKALECYRVAVAYWRANDRFPTGEELARLLAIVGRSTLQMRLDELVAKGLLLREGRTQGRNAYRFAGLGLVPAFHAGPTGQLARQLWEMAEGRA